MMESLLVPNDLQCHWLVGLVVKTLREEGGGEEGGGEGRRKERQEKRGKRAERREEGEV